MSGPGQRRSGYGRIAWLAAVLASGCAHYAPAPPIPPPVAAVPVGVAGLADFARRRVATLLWGAEQLSLTQAIGADGSLQTGFKFSPRGEFGYGKATAVDTRGYFLTAAHCVRREPVYLVWTEDSGGIPRSRLLRVRVVFQGEAAGEGTDLAVLRVGQPLGQVFAWGAVPPPGTPVASVGQDSAPAGNTGIAMDLLGGRFLGGTPHPEAAPPRVTLFHTTLIQRGDSGGPVLDLAGRLLAINVAYAMGEESVGIAIRVHATAHRPDLAWLSAVIDSDWRSHPG